MVPSSECKPGTITSGFRYGLEVAIVCDNKGSLYGFTNKMPPTGQPTTFANIEGDKIVEPVSGTAFSLSAFGAALEFTHTRTVTARPSPEGECPSSRMALRIAETGKQTGVWCPYPIGRLLIGRVTTPQDLQTCVPPPVLPRRGVVACRFSRFVAVTRAHHGRTRLEPHPNSLVGPTAHLASLFVTAVQVRKQGSKVQALINVNAKAQFEQNYWRGILDSQGKVDGGYY